MTNREWQKALDLLRVHRLAQVSVVILILVVGLAITAPVLPLLNPKDQDLQNVLLPPFWQEGGSSAHPLGTDFLGRDMLSRVIWGSQISLLVGVSAVAIAATFGISVGLVASYRGGLVDEVMMRIFDTILSIPGILIAIAVLTVLGQSLLLLIIVLGFRSTVSYARTLRSRVLSVREEQYVKAARAVGVREPLIMLRHVLPNCLAPIIVLTTIYIGVMILVEAGLSFLGLTKLHISWGVMVADSRDYLATAWWTATIPGLFIFLTVLSINILGDFFRDVFDPRLQIRTGV
jgi:peptide/nickel transport system permease protein